MARKDLKAYKIVNLVMDPEKHKQFKAACGTLECTMNQALTDLVDQVIESVENTPIKEE